MDWLDLLAVQGTLKSLLQKVSREKETKSIQLEKEEVNYLYSQMT